MKRVLFLSMLLLSQCDPAYADVFRPWGPQTSEFSGTSSAVKPTNGLKAGAIFRETDTYRQYRYTGGPDKGDSTDWVHMPEEVTLGTAEAGERIEDSTTGTDYSSTSMECGMSAEIDLSGNTSTTVYDGPAILCGYTLSVTIGTAAATIDDNTTAKVTIPVSFPVNYYGPMGKIFETSLIVNPADTSTGTLQLDYRPMDADNTWVP